jgi:hypothetical protein
MRFPHLRADHGDRVDLTTTPAARAAAALRERHRPVDYRDGICASPGFLAEPTRDVRAVIVRHILTGDSYQGIRDTDSAERTARRRPHIRAYAATLRAAGWAVRERHLPEGPAVLATPPSTT